MELNCLRTIGTEMTVNTIYIDNTHSYYKRLNPNHLVYTNKEPCYATVILHCRTTLLRVTHLIWFTMNFGVMNYTCELRYH